MAQGQPRERKTAATATAEPAPLIHEVLEPKIGTNTYYVTFQSGKGPTCLRAAVYLGHELPEVKDGCRPIEIIVRFAD